MFERFQRFEMTKRSITGLLVVAIALLVTGWVIGSVAVILALANGAVAFGGPQLVTIDTGPLAGAVVGLIVASLLTAAGTVVAVASWAAALLNTYRLEDKTWFVALLLLGLVSGGWIAMLAYVLRGPNSTVAVASARA